MGKGGGSKQQVTTTSSDISPELRGYRDQILRDAQALYEGGAPAYMSTYVSPSGQTMESLQQMEQQARGFTPFLQSAQQTMMQNLTGTNPLYDTVFKRMATQASNPFVSGGRYGSGYQQAAVAEAIAPTVANMQQQAMANLPNFLQMSMMPSQMLGRVGAAREAIERQELEEAARVAQYPYASQLGLLQDYAGIMGSVPLGQEGKQITPMQKGSPLAGALGGGLSALGAMGTGGGLAQGGAFASGGAFGAAAPYLLAGSAILGAMQ